MRGIRLDSGASGAGWDLTSRMITEVVKSSWGEKAQLYKQSYKTKYTQFQGEHAREFQIFNQVLFWSHKKLGTSAQYKGQHIYIHALFQLAAVRFKMKGLLLVS